jgi:hypothetical protein
MIRTRPSEPANLGLSDLQKLLVIENLLHWYSSMMNGNLSSTNRAGLDMLCREATRMIQATRVHDVAVLFRLNPHPYMSPNPTGMLQAMVALNKGDAYTLVEVQLTLL